MPRLDLNLSALNQQRRELAALQSQQLELDNALATQQAALDAALRAGESPNVIGMLQEQVNESRAARQQLLNRLREQALGIDQLSNGLLGELDPARMVEALDGGQPIAILPMRLETRYFPPGQAQSLRIRVYPDDINTIEHMAALTGKERQAGMDYWLARFNSNPDEAGRIARDLALGVGRSRCGWILRVLTPDNADQEGQEGVLPQFPALPVIDAKAKQTRAVLLPDRWCAIGYAAGRREVFRVWGNRIPDELVLSPDWLNLDQPEALLAGDRAWLADFDAALAKGMALEVTQQMLNANALQQHGIPFHLATDTLERLLIVGLEWSKDAQQSATELAELLAAQRDSSGLAFVPLNTPTNNTEAAASGYSPAQQRTPPPTPAENAQLPADKDALQLLVAALGLPPQGLPADGIDNAHLPEQRTALHMMNVLWRGTFGHYLMELWNPPGDENDRLLKTPAQYELRRYAVSYLRPAGPLPLLRVGKQPYGILPVAGKRFVPDAVGGRLQAILGDRQAAVEQNVSKVLSVLRPMWELASSAVPRLTNGDVDRAKDILQTSPWSQAAYYRNADAICLKPLVLDISGVQKPAKQQVIQTLLSTLGISQETYHSLPIFNCTSFPPDPPYQPGSLAGVPWVLADDKQPSIEAAPDTNFPDAKNYLKQIALALTLAPDQSDAQLSAFQSGPALLQALAACSVQLERHDAVQSYALLSGAVTKVESVAMPKLVNVETPAQNEAAFNVGSPRQLAAVVIPSLTGKASLGQHVASSLAAQPLAMLAGDAVNVSIRLNDSVAHLHPALRNVGAVKLSLEYLADRPVGELNVAFRTTLDAFSYRLDAWYTARASRRLETLRASQPTGLYVGGYAWVENLKADHRPDSDGYLLAPSLGQAASAAILRSGFLANHEQGAFNIDLDSRRTRRALDILQGLTRDQPLAALYGYRIERGLRDALLGKLIWPLRLAYPWRPAGADPSDEPKEAVGARDVVDGVALLDAWQASTANVWTRVESVEVNGTHPFAGLSMQEQQAFEAALNDAVDLADSVSDLLMAEGMHQIVQGNFERAAAAMAVADKQALPIETQVARTPRGGASYTQRVALLCPPPADDNWPQDRRAVAEPALNAWLAYMLGAPARYVFSAVVHRGQTENGNPVIDADPVSVNLTELGYSPLSAVLAATTVSKNTMTGPADTGFRGRLADALVNKLANPQTVTGLDIQQEAGNGQLGLAHFEALATTLRALLDKARPLTRKDLVVPDDPIEKNLPDEGEYPGVDAAELRARADALIADYTGLKSTLEASANADDLLVALSALEDFLPPASWPQQVQAIDAQGADPAQRKARGDAARAALAAILQTKLDALNAPIPLQADQLAPTHGQHVQQAIDQIKLLLGRDFPVLPRFSLGAYSTEFSASLAEQDALTSADPWRVPGWIPRLARVRDGLDRFAGALSAHETLVDYSAAEDFNLVQYPHRKGQTWAALPEAWREDEGKAPDLTQVPEELHDYLAQQPGAPYKDINRVAPKLALALHTPGGLAAPDNNSALAGMVCDEWAEFIPDRFQTAAIAFHYDAPGARPPQSILLAVPPHQNQENWEFDDVLDVLHEAWDLARLRAVRPRDLAGGLGLLLPGNYLPHDYTGELPGVRALELARQALRNRIGAVSKSAIIPLGKI